ncbi:MAG: MopE-related protein [Sandaracinaceae bacterium]|nr:MopE-related protein [Sandaracinaceae bacterium]
MRRPARRRDGLRRRRSGGASGAAELCDGRDNDCDGSPIAGDDLDGDGYAAASSACVEAAGTLPKTDCDDGNDAVHPGATDTCNGADDDCNGTDDDPATADASCNPTARGTSICADGACEVTSCDTGYDDCDSSASNGCEITLATDAAHCGACGSACGVGGYCRASVCRPAHVRSLRFGGVGADTVSAIAVDASGNLYITGAIEGTVNFGGSDLTSASGASIFVASFTPAGAHRWSAAYGGGGLSRGEDIAVDASGNVYVTGQLFGTANFGGGNRASAGEDDVFVASFTSAGAHRWSQRYGSTGSDRGAGLTVSGANVVVTGSFSDTVDFGGPFARVSNGSLDVFVIAYTTGAGAHAWSAAFGGAAMDLGEAIASDATGNVYVTGRGNGEMILYQFTSSGSLGWYDRYGPSGNATGADIAVDGSTLYVVGSFQSTLDLGGGVATSAGSFDVFVASYAAADGAHRWSNTYGGTSVDRAFGVALFSSQPVVAGMFGAAVDFGGGTLTSLGGLDSFVGGYQSSGGAHDWSRRDGASGSDVAADVGVSGSSVWVAGTFSGTVDFGGGGRVSAGGTDIFLLELAP